MSDREHGRITFWNDKNYGFIRPDIASERDVFVHLDEIDVPTGEEIRVGERVSYVVGADSRNGKPPRVCAKAVRLVADEPTEGAPAGMYQEPEPGTSALADGLKKLLNQ